MSDFKNKNIVITGAGGTLCSAIAKNLAASGANVALLGRTISKLEKVVNEIQEAGGHALAIACDVTSLQDVTRASEQIINTWSSLDILINGAGGKVPGSITDHTSFTSSELHDEGYGFFNMDLNVVRQEIDH